MDCIKKKVWYTCPGAFRRGGGGSGNLSTETQCILARACDAFSLFMKFGGSPKEGDTKYYYLNVLDPPPFCFRLGSRGYTGIGQ